MKFSLKHLLLVATIAVVLIVVSIKLVPQSFGTDAPDLPYLLLGDAVIFMSGIAALYVLRSVSKTRSEKTLKWFLVIVLLVENLPNFLLLSFYVLGSRPHGIITHFIFYHGNVIFKSIGSLLAVILLVVYVRQRKFESIATVKANPETET